MTWQEAQLTTREAERALRAARIPLDPAGWSAGDVARAEEVLNEAQREKWRRMLEGDGG